MHGIIQKLFDCWANPVAHLLLGVLFQSWEAMLPSLKCVYSISSRVMLFDLSLFLLILLSFHLSAFNKKEYTLKIQEEMEEVVVSLSLSFYLFKGYPFIYFNRCSPSNFSSQEVSAHGFGEKKLDNAAVAWPNFVNTEPMSKANF